MTEQTFISGLPVSATIETDEQGSTCIKMLTSEADVRLWARVCAPLLAFEWYTSTLVAVIVSIAYASIQRQITEESTARTFVRFGWESLTCSSRLCGSTGWSEQSWI